MAAPETARSVGGASSKEAGGAVTRVCAHVLRYSRLAIAVAAVWGAWGIGSSAWAAGNVDVGSGLVFDGQADETSSDTYFGAGAITKNGAASLTLNGTNSYTGGTLLNAGTLVLGNNNALGSGALVTSGTATVNASALSVMHNALSVNGDLTLVVNNTTLYTDGLFSGNGNLIKAGNDEWYIDSSNTFTGNIDLVDGFITVATSNALGNPTNVNLGSGTTLNMYAANSLGGITGSGVLNIGSGSTVTVGGSNADSVFSGAMINDGTLNKVGTGVLTYTGTSIISPSLVVSGGTLKVDGSITNANAATSVTVNSGATLTGSGSTNLTTTILNGGHLAGTSGSTLTLGSTILNQNSNIDVALGSPLTGNRSLFSVNGNLTLDGVLNITDAGGFGNGVYRLFDYSGSLINNILDYGILPNNVLSTELILQTAVNGQVNLIAASPNLIIQFWDGTHNIADGAVSGGTGVWNDTNTNWASQDGNMNGTWNSQFAVFMGSAGTVIVDGEQSVNGMQFMTDGYQLVSGSDGSLNVSNRNNGNFAVRVDPNVAAILDLDLNGSGTLQKIDSGTLVLNGNNGYTGGTLLSGGTLVVGSDTALGVGTLTTAAGTTLDSNTAVTLANKLAVTGLLTLAGSNAMTLNGNISGSGGLLKNGAGRLTLGGSNTFTGPLVLNAGGLVLASTGALGSAALNAANGTTLDNTQALSLGNTVNVAGNLTVLGSNDLTLNGLVNGAGRLVKQGVKRLALNGANGFTGGVDLQAGTLSLGHARALGSGVLTVSGTSTLDTTSAMAVGNAIQLNAGLTLAGSNDLALSGVVSGGANLTKNGLASLTLNGANTYTGGTRVQAGRLVAASSQALGLGGVTVAGGAALEVARGVELSVGGNLDLLPGSSFSIYAGCDCSQTTVGGSATLSGSELHVGNPFNPSADFQMGKTYTILHANGGVSGKFAASTSNYAYLDAALSYTANDVLLQLQRKTTGGGNTGGGNTGGGVIGFADLTETSNQASVADAIDNLPATHALHNYVLHLPNGAPAAFFSQVSGDQHATVGGSLPGLGAYAPTVSQNHMRSNLTAGLNPGAPVAQSDGPLPASAWPSSKALPAWAEVVGYWQTYNGDGNAARLKQTTTGLFVGMDEEVAHSGWRLGGSLGFTHADGRVADRNSTSKVNSYSAAVYGGKSFGTGTGPRTNVLGGLAYTWHDIATTRNITSLGQTLQADYSAHSGQLFAEVGYAIGQYDKFGFEPFVGVSLGQQRSGSFQERGGFAALQGRSSTDDIANTTLGVRLHSDFQIAGKDARLRATVGWRHAFGDVATRKTMAFEGGQNFTVAGAPLARNTALLGLEGEIALGRRAALVLGYRGELASGQRDHAANVKLRWAF